MQPVPLDNVLPDVWSGPIGKCYSRNLRTARQHSRLEIEELSERTHIPVPDLVALESASAATAPSVTALWALARALDTPFSSFFDTEGSDQVEHTTLADGGYAVTLLHRQTGLRHVEAYLVSMDANTAHVSMSHGRGVTEHIVVLAGDLLTGHVQRPHMLTTGQSLTFDAGVEHLYRSMDEPASVLVTVVYPAWRAGLTDHDERHAWPDNSVQWDDVRRHLAHLQLQCAHGIGGFKLQFEDPPFGARQSLDVLQRMLLPDGMPAGPTSLHLCMSESPSLIVLNRVYTHAVFVAPAVGTDSLRQAIGLVNAAARPVARPGADDLKHWYAIATGPSAIMATLATEVLMRHGLPQAPPITSRASDLARRPVPGRRDPLFEDRIDVGAYCAYELAHPGYARQSVALACALSALPAGLPSKTLDVGTGPGLPLKMLLELLPLPSVVAVDPSPAAHHHMAHVLGDDPRVTRITSDVDQLPQDHDGQYDAIISTGAAHHMHVGTMLHAARRLLTATGRLLICDEMISPFSTIPERHNHLVQHHVQYLLDAQVSAPAAGMLPEEAVLQDLAHAELPLAMWEARLGHTAQAVERCRRLLESFERATLPDRPSHPLLVYQRLQLLELQALVAGVDYDVEMKTSAPVFADLAREAGFTVVEHQRLYPTHGLSEWGGGTHFFVLEHTACHA